MDPKTVIANSENLIFFNSNGQSAEQNNGPFPNSVYKFYNANISSDGGRISVVAANGGMHNARYVQYEQPLAALANATGVSTLVSSGFSGCVYQLWKDKSGGVVAVHAYKDKKSGHANINDQASAAGWKLLYDWDSKGVIGEGNTGAEGFVVSMIGSGKIDTVVLVVKGGKKQKLVDWHTATV